MSFTIKNQKLLLMIMIVLAMSFNAYALLDSTMLSNSTTSYYSGEDITGMLNIQFRQGDIISNSTRYVNFSIYNATGSLVSTNKLNFEEFMSFSDNTGNLSKSSSSFTFKTAYTKTQNSFSDGVSTKEFLAGDKNTPYPLIISFPYDSELTKARFYMKNGTLRYTTPVIDGGPVLNSVISPDGGPSNDKNSYATGDIMVLDPSRNLFFSRPQGNIWSGYADLTSINPISALNSQLDSCSGTSSCLLNLSLYYYDNRTALSTISLVTLLISQVDFEYQSKAINRHNINISDIGLSLPSEGGLYTLKINFQNSDNSAFRNMITQNFEMKSDIVVDNFNNTKSFNWSNTTNFRNVSKFFIGKEGIAQINWTQNNLDIRGYNLDRYITIRNGYVYVNSASLSSLNSPAIINFYNQTFKEKPIVLKSSDGVSGWTACVSCISTSRYDKASKTFSFNVSSFSAYTLGNNSELSTGYTGYEYINQSIIFYAEYNNATSGSPITGAKCNITLEGSNHSMIYDSISHKYEYETSFVIDTTYDYTISCNASGYEPLSSNDSIIIEYVSASHVPFLEMFNLEYSKTSYLLREGMISLEGLLKVKFIQDIFIRTTLNYMNATIYDESNNVIDTNQMTFSTFMNSSDNKGNIYTTEDMPSTEYSVGTKPVVGYKINSSKQDKFVLTSVPDKKSIILSYLGVGYIGYSDLIRVPINSDVINFTFNISANIDWALSGSNLSIYVRNTTGYQLVWRQTGDYTGKNLITIDRSDMEYYLDNCPLSYMYDDTTCQVSINISFEPEAGTGMIARVNITNLSFIYQPKSINEHNIDFSNLGVYVPSADGSYRLDINFLNSTKDSFRKLSYSFNVFQGVLATEYSPSLTMNFSNVADVSSIDQPYIGVVGIGKINWSGSDLDMLGYDLDRYIDLSENYIYLNSSKLLELDSNASITFYNLDYDYMPILYTRSTNDDSESWTECSTCTNIDYDNSTGTLTFVVSGFSAYTSGANSNLNIYHGGQMYEGKPITFYANYTNSTSGVTIADETCVLNIQGGNHIMSYNDANDIYEYLDADGFFFGDYPYSVTCSALGYETLVANDTISISLIQELPIPFIKYFNKTTKDANITNILVYAGASNVTLRIYSFGFPTDPDFISTHTDIPVPYEPEPRITLGHVEMLPYQFNYSSRQIDVPYETSYYNNINGSYLYFDDYQKSDLKGYHIIAVEEVTGSDPFNVSSYYRYTFDEERPENLTVNDSFYIMNRSAPLGWQNISFLLKYNGSNRISVRINNSLTYKFAETYAEVFLDQINPDVDQSNFTQYYYGGSQKIRFDAYDNLAINLSMLSVNITNVSNSSIWYYFEYNSSNHSKDIVCNGIEERVSCNISSSLVEGNYTLNFYLEDILGNNNLVPINITVFSDLDTIYNVTIFSNGNQATVTSNETLFVNWTPINNPALLFYEYVVGYDKYPIDGWNNVTAIKSTSNNNATETLDLTIDTMYFFNVRAVYVDGTRGPWSSSEGILYVDSTVPEGKKVNVSGNPNRTDERYTRGNVLYITMEFDEPESEIVYYEYEIGTAPCGMPGHDNLVSKTRTASAYVVTAPLPLVYNRTYYVSAWAKNNEIFRNSTSNCIESNAITFDNVAPYGGNLRYEEAIIIMNGSTPYNKDITMLFTPGVDDIEKSSAQLLMASAPMQTDGNCGLFTSYTNYRSLNAFASSEYDVHVNLTNGYCYKFIAKVYDEAGNEVTYPNSSNIIAIKVDSTPPSKTVISDEGPWTLSNVLKFWWTGGVDSDSGISHYKYSVGSSPGTSNILAWRNISKNSVQPVYTPVLTNLTDGQEYYINMVAVNNLGVTSETSWSNGIYFFDNVPPAAIKIISAGNTTNNLSNPVPYYYDFTNTPNTTIRINGSESGLNCMVTHLDIGYRLPQASLGEVSCQSSGSTMMDCTINTSQGFNQLYIVCEDSVGNRQTPEQNTDILIIKDSLEPVIELEKKNSSINTTHYDMVKLSNGMIKVKANDGAGWISFNYTINETLPLNYTINITEYNHTIFNRTYVVNTYNNSIDDVYDLLFSSIYSIKTNITINISAVDMAGKRSYDSFTFMYDNTDPSLEVIAPVVSITNKTFNITINASDVTVVNVNITRIDNTTINGNYSYYNYTIIYNESVDFTNTTIIDWIGWNWLDGLYNIFIEWWNDFFSLTNSTEDYGNISLNITLDNSKPNITMPVHTTSYDHYLYFNKTVLIDGNNYTWTKLDSGIVITIDVNGVTKNVHNPLFGESSANYSGNIFVYPRALFEAPEGFENLSKLLVQISTDGPINNSELYMPHSDYLYRSDYLGYTRYVSSPITIDFTIFDYSSVTTTYSIKDKTGNIIKPATSISPYDTINGTNYYSLPYSTTSATMRVLNITSTDEFGKKASVAYNFALYSKIPNITQIYSVNSTKYDEINITINSTSSMILAYKVLDENGSEKYYHAISNSSNVSQAKQSIYDPVDISSYLDGTYTIHVIAINEFYNYDYDYKTFIVDREAPRIFLIRELLDDEVMKYTDQVFNIGANNVTVIEITQTNVTIQADYNTKTINLSDTATYTLENDVELNITVKEIIYNPVDPSLHKVVLKVVNNTMTPDDYPKYRESIILHNETFNIYDALASFRFTVMDDSLSGARYEIWNSTSKIKNASISVSSASTQDVLVSFSNASMKHENLTLIVYVNDSLDNPNTTSVSFIYHNANISFNQTEILNQIDDYEKGLFNISFNLSYIWDVNVSVYNSSGKLVFNKSVDIDYFSTSLMDTVTVDIANTTRYKDGLYNVTITLSDLFGESKSISKNFTKDSKAPKIVNFTGIPGYIFNDDTFTLSFDVNETNSFEELWLLNSTGGIFNTSLDYSFNKTLKTLTLDLSNSSVQPSSMFIATIYVNDTAGNIGNYTFNFTSYNRKPWFGKDATMIDDLGSLNSDNIMINLDGDNILVNYAEELNTGYRSLIGVYDSDFNLIYSLNSSVNNIIGKNFSLYYHASVKGDILSYIRMNFTIRNTSLSPTLLNQYLIYYNMSNGSVKKSYNISKYSTLPVYVVNDLEYVLQNSTNTSNYDYYNMSTKVSKAIRNNSKVYSSDVKKVGKMLYFIERTENNSKFNYDFVSLNMTSNTSSRKSLLKNKSITSIRFSDDLKFVYYDNSTNTGGDDYIYRINLSSNNSNTSVTRLNTGISLKDAIITSDYIFSDGIYYDLNNHNEIEMINSSDLYAYDIYDAQVVWLSSEGLFFKEFAPLGLPTIPKTFIPAGGHNIDISDYYVEYDSNSKYLDHNISLYLGTPGITVDSRNSNNTLIVNINASGISGEAWAIFNISDKAGEYSLSNNVSLVVIYGEFTNITTTQAVDVLVINASSGEELYSYAISANASTQILLPDNTNITLKIVPDGSDEYSFGIIGFNNTELSRLNLSFETINKLNVSSTSLNIGLNKRYTVLDAYALDIDSDYTGDYYAEFNYSSYTASIANISKLVIFELGYNFTSNMINYLDSNLYNSSVLVINNTSKKAYVLVSNFSAFVLAYDNAVAEICDGKDNDFDGQKDEDGVCPVDDNNDYTPSSTRSSNSGLGGGSSLYIKKEANCSDGIINQDEVAVDCGGVCGGYWYNNACNQVPYVEEPKDTGSGTVITTPPETRPKPPVTAPDIPVEEWEDEESSFSWAFLTSKTAIFSGLGMLLILGLIAVTLVLSRRRESEVNPEGVNVGEPLMQPAQPLVPLDEFEKQKIHYDANVDAEESKVDLLHRYIEDSFAKGLGYARIKANLLNKGWPEKEVDTELEMKKKRENLKMLADFINNARERGHSVDTIKHHLINARWAEHFIEMVLHDVHVIHDDLEKVKDFINTMVSKGHTFDSIKQKLMEIGWKEHIIDPLFYE